MPDENKTKEELIKEIKKLRARNKELESQQPDYFSSDSASSEKKERISSELIKKQTQKITDKYKILFESSRDAIMTLAPPPYWNFTSCNSATVRMFKGKDQYEFTSTYPWKLSPKKQPDGELSSKKAKRMIKYAMEEGSCYFEWVHRTFEGEDFSSTVLITKVEVEEGKPFLQATVRDITEWKKAEKALKESKQRFQQLVDNIDEVFYLYSKDYSKIYFVSRAFEKIWGINVNEVYNNPQKFNSAIHPEDKISVLKRKGAIINNEEFKDSTIEYRIIDTQGNQRWIRDKMFPVYDTKGNLFRIAGTALDITEQKRVEKQFYDLNQELEEKVKERTEELKRSEENFRITLNSIGDAVISVDTESKVSFMNPVAENLTEWSLEESKGKKISEIFHIVNSEETENPLTSLLQKVFEAKEAKQLDSEIKLISRSGKEYYITDSASPIKSSGGKIEGAVISFRDITKQQEQDLKLKETKELLEAVFNSIQDMLILIDKNFNINRINNAAKKFFNWTSDHTKCYQLLDRKEQCTECLLADCLKQGKTIENEFYFKSKEKWLEHRISPVLDEQGEIKNLLLHYRDLTVYKTALQKIQESEKKFMSVMKSSKEPAFLISDKKFFECNEAAVSKLKCNDKSEILGKHPSELSPPKQPDGESSYEKATKMIDQAYTIGVHNFNWLHRTLNNEDILVEVSLIPVPYKEKTILYCVWHG